MPIMNSEPDPIRVLCLGCGYTALAYAAALRRDWPGRIEAMTGTARSGASLEAIERAGLEALVFSGEPGPDLIEAARSATHVLLSIPPGPDGDPALALAGAMKAGRAAWVGYLSATSVFGDRGGGWAHETDPPSPVSETGVRRVQAEAAWLATDLPVVLFRLPGIYGPGRSALDRVRRPDARTIDKPGQVFSRVHVDDIASGLIASMRRPRPGAAYTLCDDEPAPSKDVDAFAAALLGLPAPPLTPHTSLDPASPAARFYRENKRCSNALAKDELGWRPLYPSYREGLAAIHAAQTRDDMRDETG